MSLQSTLWQNAAEQPGQELEPIPPAADGTPAEAWLGGVHPEGQLEVTSGFHLHGDKFSRMLAYLAHERQARGSVYKQLMQSTGMSNSQVQALVQYGTNMALLVPRSLRVTPLGHLVLEHDPFFDRPGTLWLLHYLLASNPLLVVWNYMCNAILPGSGETSMAEASRQFLPFIGRWSEQSIRKNVRKELRAFFAGYTTAMFAGLEYLAETDKRHVYRVNRAVVPVPPLILLATALIYRDRHLPGASGLEIPALVYADHSPGRLTRQSETYLRQSLDRLHESGLLTIESKANLDQVRFRVGGSWLVVVREYYEN